MSDPSENSPCTERVLILAPTGRDASVLRETLESAGLCAGICVSLEDLCGKLEHGAGVAVIAEEALRGPAVDALAQALERQPEWSDIPLVIMASSTSEPDAAWFLISRRAPAANAVVLERPVLTGTILAAVRSSLRSRRAQYRIARELKRRRKAEESLAAAVEEMKTYSYSVSHDLRAPLRHMSGFSEALLEDYHDKLDEIGKEYLERILKSAHRMNELIEDMLSLSQISQQEMVVRQVDLSSLAREIIEELQQSQPQRQVEVHIEAGLQVRGDARLLRLALTNLLNNAWKYTGKTPRPTIEFGALNQNEASAHWRLAGNNQSPESNAPQEPRPVYFVCDNGAGFPMERAAKLFKPFQRLHADAEFPGTGIGLPIVARVIQRHGGSIRAESEIDKGACFYFSLGE